MSGWRRGAATSKAIGWFVLLVVLALSAVAGAAPAHADSGPLCTPFGETVQEKWGPCSLYPNIAVTTDNAGSISGPSDWYLKLTDHSGASAACSSDPKYQGDWIAKMGGCGQFCLDARIFEIPLAPLSVIYPSFTIIGSSGSATFQSTVATTTDVGSNPGWHHICAPVRLTLPGETTLPSSPDGHWVLVSGSSFNAVIQNVSQLLLRVDYTSQPSEVVGYDNICMTAGGCGGENGDDDGGTIIPDPVVTGCLKDSKVEVTCNPDGTYTLTLDGTSFAGDDITLTSETPGVTVATAEQPWSPTTTWVLVGASAGQTVKLRANTTRSGGGSVTDTDLCCSGEIVIVMPECPKPTPPIDVAIGKENTPGHGGGGGFNIWITNLGAPITFPAGGLVVTDVIPPGMLVTGIASPNWTCTPTSLAGPGTITCVYALAGTLPTNGSLADAIVIADIITNHEQPLKNCATIAIGSSVGTDTVPTNNEACVTVTDVTDSKIDVGIDKTGGTTPYPPAPYYAFHLRVTNHGSAFTGTNVIIVTDVVPLGMTFDAASGTDWACNAPPSLVAGQTLICTYTGTAAIASGAVLGTIDVSATATGLAPFPPFTNCAMVGLAIGSGLIDVAPPNDTSCVTVSKPAQTPIDLRVDKEDMPWIGATNGFAIWVTNVGAPVTFQAGDIVVTDEVPVGMTATGATAPNWTCQPFPLVGPGSLTCTYNLAGTLATGAAITDQIIVNGTISTDKPVLNCATIDVAPGAGADINPQNDRSCVTFTPEQAKAPLACDPRTTKASADTCICLYKKMSKTSPTSCECPAGTNLVSGKGCVAKLICTKPLVANSKGTACVCPGTLVFNGKSCVAKIVCEAPAVPNKAGTACLCPKNTIPTDNGCTVRTPNIKLPKLPNLPLGDAGLGVDESKP